MVGLLSQRGPKATISLVYCMARAASTCKAGPTGSIGFAAAGAGEAGALGLWAAAASFLVSSQPSRTAVERRNSHTLRRRYKITPALLAAQIAETTPQPIGV